MIINVNNYHNLWIHDMYYATTKTLICTRLHVQYKRPNSMLIKHKNTFHQVVIKNKTFIDICSSIFYSFSVSVA